MECWYEMRGPFWPCGASGVTLYIDFVLRSNGQAYHILLPSRS